MNREKAVEYFPNTRSSALEWSFVWNVSKYVKNAVTECIHIFRYNVSLG
jgi:hypothetical protein